MPMRNKRQNENYQESFMLTKRPLIAITTSYKGERKGGSVICGSLYLNAIWQSGGIPVAVQWTEGDDIRLDEYINEFDGFLFSGGGDVNPVHFGQTVMHDTVKFCDERDEFELALCRKAIESGKPVFGICRGEQLINVAMGGTLHQHIEDHKQADPSLTYAHKIKVTEGSHLASLLVDDTLEVNTFHHQAVDAIAPGLVVSGYSEDGYIEAFQSLTVKPYGLQIEAVQWHPERMFDKDDFSRRLIKDFVSRVALSKALREENR